MTIDERVAELVAKAPPLTDEERARLQQLLALVSSHATPSTRSGSRTRPSGRRARTTATESTVTPMAQRRADDHDGHRSGHPGPATPVGPSKRRRSG